MRPFAVTHGSVFRLAVPMTLAYLSTPLVGVVDMAVVGQLGVAALVGGIAIGALVFDFVFATFNFLRSGTTGLTAQAFGADDARGRSSALLRALIVALASGVVIAGAAGAVHRGRRPALMGPQRGRRRGDRDYCLRPRLGDALRARQLRVLGWLIGLGRIRRRALLLQTLLNGLNIVLSVFFVLGLGLGRRRRRPGRASPAKRRRRSPASRSPRLKLERCAGPTARGIFARIGFDAHDRRSTATS